MSSFICTPKHFNSIEAKFFKMLYRGDFYCPYSLKEICPKWYNKRNWTQEVIEEEIFNHLNTLRELNALCVCLQYRDSAEPGTLDKDIEEQTKITKIKTSIKDLTDLGFYNALRCLFYQIETEHLKELRSLTVEEENAMQFLDIIINVLANYIVGNLPKDKTNTWLID